MKGRSEMKPQVQMLRNCFDLIQQDKRNQEPKATARQVYEQLLDWLGYKLSIEAQITTPPFQLDTHEALNEIFNKDLLVLEMWDWFGELSKEVGLLLPGTLETVESVQSFVTFFTEDVGESLGTNAKVVLDASAGTGRMILGYAKTYKNRLLFYGVEPDKLAYRTALLNMKLYGIQGFILCANPDVHDLKPKSHNWLAANMWYPLAGVDLVEA
jgi:hypothetical protein